MTREFTLSQFLMEKHRSCPPLSCSFPRGRDIFSLYSESTDTLRWARWSGVFLFITWCLLLVGSVQAVSTGIVHQASLEWNDHMLTYRFLGARPALSESL